MENKFIKFNEYEYFPKYWVLNSTIQGFWEIV